MDIRDAVFDEEQLKEDRLKVYEERCEQKKKRAEKMGTGIEGNLKEPSKHLYPKSYGGSYGDDLISVNPGKCIYSVYRECTNLSHFCTT
jgi:hypothetical protein